MNSIINYEHPHMKKLRMRQVKWREVYQLIIERKSDEEIAIQLHMNPSKVAEIRSYVFPSRNNAK